MILAVIFFEVCYMTKSRFDDLIIQAEIAEANGRHDSALECYKKALADKPDDRNIGICMTSHI